MGQLSTNWLTQLPIDDLASYRPVSGGDINDAYQLTDRDGTRYFMKVQPNHPASYFDHEVSGLKAIGKVISTPQPLHQGQINGDAFLILNWLDAGHGSQFELGKAVALMHSQHSQHFGFADSHQTGAIAKDNSWNDSWVDFYLQQRLMPEVAAASRKGSWSQWRQSQFEKMVDRFSAYYRDRQVVPSLLHGDLWAGNYMFLTDGTPALIDPDALYGDPEFDLAMTTVFGGFEPEFYQGYQSVRPLAAGLDERLSWYRFYYLCMHLILFGEMYGGAVDDILARY